MVEDELDRGFWRWVRGGGGNGGGGDGVEGGGVKGVVEMVVLVGNGGGTVVHEMYMKVSGGGFMLVWDGVGWVVKCETTPLIKRRKERRKESRGERVVWSILDLRV